MKKIILSAVIFILFGFILGQILFSEKLVSVKNIDQVYFLQEGVYVNKNNLQNNLIELVPKVIENINNKYYVYLGITRDKKVLKKLQDIYKDKGIKVYVHEKNINSPSFIMNVEQFDLLINDTNDSNQVLTIEEIVLSNYEEMIKK